MALTLQGKVAVITGAASGIGLATVELFVAQGAQVLAADRQADRGQALADRFPGQVRFEPCDVTRSPDLKRVIDSAAQHFGGLDILFSNAGAGGTPAGVEAFDDAAWDATQALLLRSVAAGAASGIGLATVELFVEAGARVIAADLQVDPGQRAHRASV